MEKLMLERHVLSPDCHRTASTGNRWNKNYVREGEIALINSDILKGTSRRRIGHFNYQTLFESEQYTELLVSFHLMEDEEIDGEDLVSELNRLGIKWCPVQLFDKMNCVF